MVDDINILKPYYDRVSKELERVNKVREEFNKETDRGCALMAVSFLENELRMLIEIKVIGGKKFIETLFDSTGPLNTFSSQIKLAYAVGLINKDTLDRMNLIRKIRNEFGHSYASLTFESYVIKQMITKLKEQYKKETMRDKFIDAVLVALAHLHVTKLVGDKFKLMSSFPVKIDDVIS